MVKSHSRALLLQQQEEAKELINVSLSLSSSWAKHLVWFSHNAVVTKTLLVVPCGQEAFHSEVLKEHRHMLPYRFA
jgi:hypothetical protein